MNFNYDAIEQLEVLTSAFDPEYGYNLGGSINVVTRAGGNTLEVNTGLYYSNGNWAPKLDARYAADGYELAPTDFDTEYQLLRAGSTVSGPIVRDKLWYIASYQKSQKSRAHARRCSTCPRRAPARTRRRTSGPGADGEGGAGAQRRRGRPSPTSSARFQFPCGSLGDARPPCTLRRFT